MMRWFSLAMSVSLLATLFSTGVRAESPEPRLVDVQKIWDAAPHNAFSDLARFGDQWFCVFREGAGHVSPDGALRVLVSADGDQWHSAARIEHPEADLRDAKIAVTPDGRLMLTGAAAWHDRSRGSHQTFAWYSDDGTEWSEPQAIGEPDYWLWSMEWHGERAYSMGYSTGDERNTRLYSSDDGRQFDVVVPRLVEEGYPNETALVFVEERMYCLMRRDGTPASALLGRSEPPYTEWTWHDLGTRIGGPAMICLSDDRFVAAVRLLDGQVRTSLCWVDPEAGTLTEFLPLPSGGDTSYAGLVEHEGMLWISYYASHEGKTSIYLARVALESP